ncbi:LPXTG cell wall anchor domain-containing protein [Streptomyces cathayae]|uniref:LPXTG cell wall anchor domain-containing protein n=1 Tax=Streptomyces cathayae TaxID=3031124 RepID=A0ABY8K302_9ACTN|nr:LPXTG cell wall anchor domain-containing protein [Streptomyces sp. HUAS 5]WGD41261.1 LPXTG cell wall anchor domain-containing protein [Streptomyces sp. HUAS 5]
MKLRRAMAVAAATAVIAPAALLAAPAAYATDETTPSPIASESTPGETEPTKTDDPAPETTAPEATDDTDNPGEPKPEETDEPKPEETDEPEPGETDEPEPGETETDEPEPSETEPEESETPDPEPSICEDTKVDVGFSGLPGKIAVGSGWHKFSLDVVNNSDSTLEDLDYFAGASPDKYGEDMFRSKHVQLQVWDPEDEIWADLNDGGYAVGYIGYSTELEAGYQVNIPMRINVKASAPVGAGFSLGATIYGDSDGECTGYGEVSYKFQIVSAGTDTDGTKPQVGGKAPVTDKKPAADTPKVTGSLAETGAGSALPMIGLLGGAAVAAGAGAVFVVRRRKAGAVA